MQRVSRKLGSVDKVVPGRGADSPITRVLLVKLVLANVQLQGKGMLTSKDRSIKLRITRNLNEAHISRQLVSSLDVEDVSRNDVRCHDLRLSPIPLHKTVLWQHIRNTSHHPTTAPILPSIEPRLSKKHSNEHNGQCQVGDGGVGIAEWFPADEDEDTADAENATEAFEEITQNLFGVVGWWGGVDVFAVFFELADGALYGKALGFGG